MGGVDFATAAARRLFESIDLNYDGAETGKERWGGVQREIASTRRIVTSVISSTRGARIGLTPALLDSLTAAR